MRLRLPVLLAALLATGFFASWLPRLEMDPDTEAYVPKRHPIRQFWEEAKNRFGIGREILVAVEGTGPDGVFTPEILRGVAELTEGIKKLDGIIDTDVRSLTDADAIIGTEEGLDFQPFYERPPADAAEAAQTRRKVFENPVYLDRLVSRDATIAAIIVRVHHGEGAPHPTHVYRSIQDHVDAHPIPGARILLAGNPAVEYWYGRQMAADLAALIPLAVLTVIVVLFACFRGMTLGQFLVRVLLFAAVTAAFSMWRSGAAEWTRAAVVGAALAMLSTRGVLLPTIVVAASVIWTWGLQAMLGLPIYIAGTMVPPLLLAIGCAAGIHVMERYFEKAERGLDRDEVVIATMSELWRPVVLSAVTTAFGFGSLVVGRMTVYQVFGFTAAFGVLVAMLMSLTVLPATLALLPLPAKTDGRRRRQIVPDALASLGKWIEGHRAGTAGGAIAIVSLFAVSSAWLRVDYSWVESLEPGTPVLEADRVLRSRHGGTMPLNVIVRAAEPGGIKDPQLLRAMERVLERISEHPYVGDTRSIAEYIERMNQAMNEDRPEALRVPDERDLVAQYLLLYSMSGDPTELDDVVDYDYQAANLAILLRSDGMRVMDDVIARVEELLDEYVRPLGATATPAGSAMIQKTVLDIVFVSQVYSLATAAVLVLLVMWLLFRSLTHALVCMLGPLVTAVVNFGAMGLFGIQLGPDKAMVSAIALGIGIDYSIHLMSHFRDVRAEGVAVDTAIVEAMRTTGRAILFNGLVVCAGFAILGASRSPSNAVFGWMIASNMAVACAAALVLMPTALTILGHRDVPEAGTVTQALRPRPSLPWLDVTSRRPRA